MANKEIDLKQKIEKLKSLLEKCELCPRKCRVNRAAGQKGACRAGMQPAVYSQGAHHGEEPALSGKKGSGTIFFTHCTMSCVYCQNFAFSQLSDAEEISIEELGERMLKLESQGCHNINLVSPTHYSPQIAEAVFNAKENGLTVPVVYNTSGYELPEIIKLLEGFIDIYLPDMRYSENGCAFKYSNAANYVENNREAIKEMYKQCGDLKVDEKGIAFRGLIIRCLVLPEDISGTEKSLEFIAGEISPDSYVSLMSQYYPVYKAESYPELSRKIKNSEYKKITDKLESLGLHNGWVQEAPSEMDTSFGGHRIKRKDLGFLNG